MANQSVTPHTQYSFVVDRVVPKQVITKTKVIEVERKVRQLVREMPASDQPVNRLQHYGPTSLSSAELVAAVLQTPDALSLAHELLARFNGLLGLARASIHELCSVAGIGPAKTSQLKAALELGRRLLIASPKDRPQVKSPVDAANLVMTEMMTLNQEHFRVICLNSKNYVIETVTLYVGSLNTSVIRVGEVFETAIKCHAAAILVVHNHPSGDPTPSPEDVNVTGLLVQAGKLLDIDVLDHLVVGHQRYVSLKERGLGFS